MNRTLRRMLLAAGLMALVGVVAAPVSAQVFTGRIEVTVVDESGAVLPGVTINITGMADQETVTDERGEGRFLNLPVGNYTVTAQLAGFGVYKNPSIVVVAGQAAELRVALKVAGQEETIEVVGESPIIDTKKQVTATNVTLDEMQNIPSSRDPWVVMQTVPGIVVDRVNVGGAESGQQSSYQAKGAAGDQNTWNMDGIQITDMGATGASPTYYDFDMFQEMQVTTGGADASNATSGVALNMVLKSGANTPHGSARFFYESEDLQANNMPEELAIALGSPNGKGNRIDEILDRGFEVGGPIWKDKIWAWGAYGKNDVKILTIRQTPDTTFLENYAFKGTGQIGTSIRPSYTYFRGNKEKFGRNASAVRPPETTWDQTGPFTMNKVEASFVVANNLFLVGRYANIAGGFSLTPQGGLDTNMWIDTDGVYHGSYWYYATDRPQDQVVFEGNWFKNNHEVKFGYTWRKTPVTSESITPGNKVYISLLDDTTREFYAGIVGDYNRGYEGEGQALWIGDTMTFSRLTLTAALRWDHSSTSATPPLNPAVPGYEDLIPTIEGNPIEDAIVWNTWSPRIGVSYALNESRKTILRGSYAMFAGVLGPSWANDISTAQYRAVYYYGFDKNRDNIAQRSELTDYDGQTSGWELGNPNPGESPNTLDPDLESPKTQEIIVGLDHELARNFAVSGSFTWRYMTDFVWRPLTGIRSTNYVQTGALAGTDSVVGSYNTPYYGLNGPAPAIRSLERTNRDGYHQRFWGLEFSATKRLSNRWMARFAFSTNDHREYFDDPATSIQDPTPSAANPLVDGGRVVTQSGGSGKSGIYSVLPAYQIIANGYYQGPWGLNFGANYVGREGFAMPYFRSRVATRDPLGSSKTVRLVNEVDDFRLPMAHSFDIRFEKVFAIKRTNLILDLDIFNVFNFDTVLGRQYDQRLTGPTGYNNVLEIMNPRVARLGVRFNF